MKKVVWMCSKDSGQRVGAFGLGLMVVLLGACSTAALTQSGAEVATSPSAPIDHGYEPGSCKSLGYIVGRGGGSFGGGWLSNDDLVEYAMNDLRNKAAELGANYIQHDSPQLGVSGDKHGTSTSTATVSGTAYSCEKPREESEEFAEVSARKSKAKKRKKARASAEAKAESAAKQPKQAAYPSGAGGFKFGAPAEVTEKSCVTAKYVWKRSGDVAECSGTPVSLDAPARALLNFCHERLCGITLIVEPGQEQILAKYDSLYTAIRSKYGPPKDDRLPIDEACVKSLETCLASEHAPKPVAWHWPEGYVTQILLESNGSSPVIGVHYTTPERAEQLKPGPAL